MSVIAIDIDSTLAYKAPWVQGDHIAAPCPEATGLIRELAQQGHHLYAWTCRADYVVDRWLRQHNLRGYFKGINVSPLPSDSLKGCFDFYIGDEAVRWTPGCSDEVLKLIAREGELPTTVFARDKGFSSHAPVPYLAGVGKMFVDSFEDHWRRAWEDYSFGRPIAFLTICSHAKPYSKSFIHSTIREDLHRCGYHEGQDYDYIHISNAGIIPAEAEMTWPFNAYDWNGDLCDEETRAYHIAAIERRFNDWLHRYGSRYAHIVIYLRGNGNTYGAVERVLMRRGRPEQIRLVDALALDEHYPEHVRVRDPDDCLTHHRNLSRLRVVLPQKD